MYQTLQAIYTPTNKKFQTAYGNIETKSDKNKQSFESK